MINDAIIQVTCDGEGCQESVDINPEYIYTGYSGKDGYYDTRDSSLEKKIENEGWLVVDKKHYCSATCEPK